MGACFSVVTIQVFFYLTQEKRNGHAPPIDALRSNLRLPASFKTWSSPAISIFIGLSLALPSRAELFAGALAVAPIVPSACISAGLP